MPTKFGLGDNSKGPLRFPIDWAEGCKHSDQVTPLFQTIFSRHAWEFQLVH